MEASGGEVVLRGGEGVEVEADPMDSLVLDLELIGGGASEDPGIPMEGDGVRGRVGEGDLAAVGTEDGWGEAGVGEERAAVVEVGGGGSAAGDEVVVRGREADRGEGGDEGEKEEETGGEIARDSTTRHWRWYRSRDGDLGTVFCWRRRGVEIGVGRRLWLVSTRASCHGVRARESVGREENFYPALEKLQ